GIEPLYSLAFFRNVLRGQKEGETPLIEINPVFDAVARQRGFLSEGLMERVATDGTLAHCKEAPADVRRLFVCAHDVSPRWHMLHQAAFQRHCDASISKTINFAENAAVEDVDAIYRMAYELKCKGVTVYRNGSRKHQPMALKGSDRVHAQKTTESVPEDTKPQPLQPAVLPELCPGIRVRQLTPFGNMHINITVDPKTDRELEVFAQLGKGGDLANSDLEAICRMISLWLRSGGSLEHVVRQLHSIGSSLQVHTKEGKIMSLGDGLARALRKYMQAKAEIGLRSLLLGNCDQKTLGRALKDDAQTSRNGNGNGNGHGKGENGHSGFGIPSDSKGESEQLAEACRIPMSSTKPSGDRFFGDTASSSRSESNLGNQWQQSQYKVVCPDCQGPLRYCEGCVSCEVCGFSKC
ncbi:MAG: hypothetical protein AABZ47_10355, partial [Planctomycetota bacterium]